MVIKTLYRCWLINTIDEADIEIPVSSISGSFNVSNNRNLLIVCPDGKGFALAAALRYSGEFAIYPMQYHDDGSIVEAPVILGNINDINSDRGTSSWSVSIRGSKQISNPTPTEHRALEVATISTNSSGKRRIRMLIDWTVRPQDTLTYNEEIITVGSISYTVSVSPENHYMTVVEA